MARLGGVDRHGAGHRPDRLLEPEEISALGSLDSQRGCCNALLGIGAPDDSIRPVVSAVHASLPGLVEAQLPPQ